MKLIFLSALTFIASLSLAENYKELQKNAFSESQDMSVRWNSLMAMAKMKKNESVIDLKKALASNVWYMRNAGLIALDSVNAELAYDVAKKQLDDASLVVRSTAVDILAKNKKKITEVRELLWQELHAKKNKNKSKSLWIRPQIGLYLAEQPLDSEKEKFLTLVEEKDDEVRVIAEKALLKLQKN